MVDAFCTILFLGFFGILIYSIMTQPKKAPPAPAAPPVPPSPVGLYCSICNDHADVVSSEEYARLSAAGVPVYCRWCMITIEAYKTQQGRSR